MKTYQLTCEYCGYKWLSSLYWVPDEIVCARQGCNDKNIQRVEVKENTDVFGYGYGSDERGKPKAVTQVQAGETGTKL